MRFLLVWLNGHAIVMTRGTAMAFRELNAGQFVKQVLDGGGSIPVDADNSTRNPRRADNCMTSDLEYTDDEMAFETACPGFDDGGLRRS